MKIDIVKLEFIMTTLLSEIKKRRGTVIDVEYDYYWDIPMNLIYDPYVEPSDKLDLGQLSFDWDNLLKIEDENEAFPWHFKLVSNIIKVLCYEPSDTKDRASTYIYST